MTAHAADCVCSTCWPRRLRAVLLAGAGVLLAELAWPRTATPSRRTSRPVPRRFPRRPARGNRAGTDAPPATLPPDHVDPPETSSNVCEHGDHPAPPGKRFCSPACQACDVAECDDADECARICTAPAPPPVIAVDLAALRGSAWYLEPPRPMAAPRRGRPPRKSDADQAAAASTAAADSASG